MQSSLTRDEKNNDKKKEIKIEAWSVWQTIEL
jgi:hypothetical protein